MKTATRTIGELIAFDPVVLPLTATVADAADAMRDNAIGDVMVVDGDQLCGIVTDRDIVIRVISEGRDPKKTPLSDVCSSELVVVDPDTTVPEAVDLLRLRTVRRLPVVERGRPVGLVTIGDLALESDPGSALAEISAAPPNT